jgi:hypothetical protein
VADVKALKNDERTLLDRYPLRNMGFFMFPGVPPVFALAMGSDQGQNEIGSILVDPLINSFMANGESRVLEAQSSGDKFWRPSQANAFFGILSNQIHFQSLSLVGFPVPFIRSFLGFVSQVIASVNRRGISLKLPRKGAGASVENFSDIP